MLKRFLPIFALLALNVTSGTAGREPMYRGKLLPDLPQHLHYAQQDCEEGHFEQALAHTTLILFDRPVRYKIQYNRVDRDQRPFCLAAVRDAVALWEGALAREVSFQEVNGREPADVIIRFQKDVQDSGMHVAGHVDWTRKVLLPEQGSPYSELRATIQVRAFRPGGRVPMTLEQMRHSVAHELGHVLGLDDSPFEGDIMGPLNLRQPVSVFAATELDFLRELRDQAQEVRNEALRRLLALRPRV